MRIAAKFLTSFELFSLVLLGACGPDSRDRENYGDITVSPGGISLIDPSEHRGGYGRRECLVCHNASLNLHRGPSAGIDVDQLNRDIRAGGEATY